MVEALYIIASRKYILELFVYHNLASYERTKMYRRAVWKVRVKFLVDFCCDGEGSRQWSGEKGVSLFSPSMSTGMLRYLQVLARNIVFYGTNSLLIHHIVSVE